MADDASDSGSEFGDLIDQLIAERAQGLGVDNQSDISVSTVHTADLSDFDSEVEIDSSESDAEVDSDAEWVDIIEDFEKEPFESEFGPTMPLGLDAKPVEYFLQLFPETLFQKIKEETERYAHQQGAATFTSVAEIKAYLGMLFLMGVVQLPSYRHYWSKNPVLRQHSIASVMPRNRYELLTKYFHLNDSTKNPARNFPGHDKLHKVRPVLDNAKKKFPRHYKPHKNVAVDEAMIKFKGRCSFLQYIPSKPCKWGIKAWAIADSESFYLVDFNIYTGKDVNCVNNVPLGTRVVCDLVKPLYKKFHHVYFDNFFTSVQLLEALLRKKNLRLRNCPTKPSRTASRHKNVQAEKQWRNEKNAEGETYGCDLV